VQVQVVGSLAITTWDFTLFNPQDRILEGEFVFPLGEGQTVSRFAMDVNGKLREGVVVDKAKGRQAFEEIVRRGVDPGLSSGGQCLPRAGLSHPATDETRGHRLRAGAWGSAKEPATLHTPCPDRGIRQNFASR
jgi:hypothetical protein